MVKKEAQVNEGRQDGGPRSLAMPEPQRLLAWYDTNARRLPWRRDSDPYRVLVSEVMLQQTRVEVVANRFEGFLEAFPDLEALAAASAEEIVAAWSGLGYYRRARSLHACARELVERREWPRTAAELKRLPGIGDYTAAAVASIVFGEPVVAVDGNVKRLAARLTATRGDPGRQAVLDRLRDDARRWLDPERPGDSNQALMELGATVCKPRPLCSRCPLTAACRGLLEGDPTAFPQAKRAKPSRKRHWRLAVIRDGGRVWLARRSDEESWLPGIYELPWVEAGDEPAASAATMRQRYGITVHFGERLGEVRHAIGRRDIHAEVWSAALDGSPPAGAVSDGLHGAWADRDERAQLATSSLVAKALSLADEEG